MTTPTHPHRKRQDDDSCFLAVAFLSQTVYRLAMDLKTYIATFGFTQAQIADGIGVRVSTINNYLTGLRCPKWPMLLRLEDFTGKKVTVREMISYYEQKQAERRIKSAKTKTTHL